MLYTEPLYRAGITPVLSRTVALHLSLGFKAMLAGGAFTKHHKLLKKLSWWRSTNRLVDVQVLGFKSSITAEQLSDYLERHHLEHAPLSYLLACAALQKAKLPYRLLACGSELEVVEGHRSCVPCFDTSLNRNLDLVPLQKEWRPHYRFLVTPILYKESRWEMMRRLIGIPSECKDTVVVPRYAPSMKDHVAQQIAAMRYAPH